MKRKGTPLARCALEGDVDLVCGKNVFVMTSNIDVMSARHSFDESRIFTL